MWAREALKDSNRLSTAWLVRMVLDLRDQHTLPIPHPGFCPLTRERTRNHKTQLSSVGDSQT